MRFGIVTDIHFTTAEDTAALRSTILGWHENGIRFAFQLGDIIAGEPGTAMAELDQVIPELNRYGGTIRHVIGNHCLAIPENTLLGALGMERPYYSFMEGGYRFIVLHGMDVSVLSIPKSAEDGQMLERFRANPELHDYCGAIGAMQKTWLKGMLEQAEQAAEHVIIICHFPLLPETTDLKHGLLWNHGDISSIIVSSPSVRACFSGHYHHGAHTERNGIHFIVLPAFVRQGADTGFISGTVEIEGSRLTIRNQNNVPFHALQLR
ncbi:MAG: metallophosphoesterase [Chlorobiaceae bacterium]|nr:metallophosphoesterase [Chlorobiaceae bacterium]